MRPRPPESTTAKSFSGPQQAETPAALQHAPAVEVPPAEKAPATPEALPAAKAPALAKGAQAEARADAAKTERVRVCVKSSVRDPNLLLVRILGAGQSVPSGCHEAFLSPAHNGIDLRSLGE
jgi:hypothetical protein